MPDRRGVFVVVEGIDGCGSSTQAERLVSDLRAQGQDARLTREPSAGPVGQLIRRALQRGSGEAATEPPCGWATLALLFAADRMDHLERDVLPALQQGAVVVSDRYDLSSLVYQSITAPEGRASLEWIQRLNEWARRPDLTIVIDIDPDVAEGRRRQRGGTEELFEDAELQRRLAEGYRYAARLVPRDRVVHVPGHTGVDEVAGRIRAALRAAGLAALAG